MKKILALILSMILTLSIAGLALAVNISTDIRIVGEMDLGYLYMPGYGNENKDSTGDKSYQINGQNCDQGAFWGQFRNPNIRLINDMTITDGLYAELVNQWEMYKDDTDRQSDNFASPVQNFNLTYNPGLFRVQFDLKGQDIPVGIKDHELMFLNVARLYAKDAQNYLYRNWQSIPETEAKQLTVDVPFDWGKIMGVFALEQQENSDAPGFFDGALVEYNLENGKIQLGYQAKVLDVPYPIYSAYYDLCIDYKFAPDIRLRADYCTQDTDNSGNKGFIAYWRPIDELEIYPGTPFRVTGQINSQLDLNKFTLKLRLIQTTDWDNHDLAYWADASYYFKPFTAGVNYRNWAFDAENQRAQDDGRVIEYYVKHDLTPSWRDSMKVFCRSDRSCGVIMVISFY
jgi:hypothetical protein